jgi:hypothetical protein
MRTRAPLAALLVAASSPAVASAPALSGRPGLVAPDQHVRPELHAPCVRWQWLSLPARAGHRHGLRDEATVTDVLDGAGARRLVQTGGGAYRGDPTIDVNFATQTLGTTGTVASTLGYDSAVQPSSGSALPRRRT